MVWVFGIIPPIDITVRGDGNEVRLADSEIIDTQDALRVGGDAVIGFIGGNLNNDGAIINVGNFPSNENSTALPGTGEAGSLTIEANSLSIEDGSRIDAATQAGNGGNITLNIADSITLKDTGFISARALQDANGGNINIDTDFIIAFPQGNNDIIANAQRGNGGNININAESLFGI